VERMNMEVSSRPVEISRGTRKVMEALADTIIPGGDEGPGALDVDLVDRFLDFLRQFPPVALRLFSLSCWMWEFCPIWSGRFARFSGLSLEERTRMLESWENSRFLFRRGALIILKSIFLATFYNNREVWPLLGYEEGCLSEPPHPIGD
jgi:hypothetical protein